MALQVVPGFSHSKSYAASPLSCFLRVLRSHVDEARVLEFLESPENPLPAQEFRNDRNKAQETTEDTPSLNLCATMENFTGTDF